MRHDIIHRARDGRVLEHAFGKIDDVIDDHLGARVGQGTNVIAETDFAGVGGRESEVCCRRHIMHDLAHGTAFIAARRKILEHQNRGRVVWVTRSGKIARSHILICRM